MASVEACFAGILDGIVSGLDPDQQEHVRRAPSDSFGSRFVATAEVYDASLIERFEISFPFTGLTRETAINLDDSIFDLLTCDEILDVVESVIGPEIALSPVQHTRMKLPVSNSSAIERNGALTATTGWHQDQSAVLPEADGTSAIAVWVAMTDATLENGCLTYLPGSHRTGLGFHCPPSGLSQRGGSNIPLAYIDEPAAVCVPISKGDILIHQMLTKHASQENGTSDLRWSFDLRYQQLGAPSGRPFFPSVPARSQENPSVVVTSAQEWRDQWMSALDKAASAAGTISFNRWNTESANC